MIILAFDFGTKNIGVAVGQKITNTARSLQPIQIYNKKINWNNIHNLIITWEPKLMIVGYPLNMDGTKQKITHTVKYFAKELYTRFLIPIKLQDERLTTIESKSILYLQGGYKKLNKNKIDSLSAVLILESWFSKNCI
ncbi:Putative pre-16S rRNA nuclease [Buchnera aphidicola (Pterocallis alni)]|uniref:Holliday junction resolvase RuvX n=1 Tax=Buchnera aphidicola TaxID=9 RepID=UPI003463DBDA